MRPPATPDANRRHEDYRGAPHACPRVKPCRQQTRLLPFGAGTPDSQSSAHVPCPVVRPGSQTHALGSPSQTWQDLPPTTPRQLGPHALQVTPHLRLFVPLPRSRLEKGRGAKARPPPRGLPPPKQPARVFLQPAARTHTVASDNTTPVANLVLPRPCVPFYSRPRVYLAARSTARVTRRPRPHIIIHCAMEGRT